MPKLKLVSQMNKNFFCISFNLMFYDTAKLYWGDLITRSLKLRNDFSFYFFSEILALNLLNDCGFIPK